MIARCRCNDESAPRVVRPNLDESLARWSTTPLTANAANAAPDWGLFAGRTASLIPVYPLTMGSLLAFALYTAYLGFQWRRQRTLGNEINALQLTLPPPNLDSPEMR
jgi:hypothetical protein